MADKADKADKAESGTYQHLRVERRGFSAWVTLARPEVHNAFNAELIAELHTAFDALSQDDTLGAVVLAGEGRNFCA
ncbi:MAG TPA: enoyl-CoA hydratase-related protein, partial [Ktedonobacterales bacterium]